MFMQKFRNMRKMALQLLLLWLFSANASALQNCCETIAAAIPHHDAHDQVETDSTDHHAGHGQVETGSAEHQAGHGHSGAADTHQDGSHEHCPTISADTHDVALLEPIYSGQLDHKVVAYQPRQLTDLQQGKKFSRPDNSIWIVNRRSTYLDTLRLRV